MKNKGDSLDRRRLVDNWIIPQYGSISNFADAVGISRNAMSDILHGKYYPRVKHYLRMAELLNLDPWALRVFLPDLDNE